MWHLVGLLVGGEMVMLSGALVWAAFSICCSMLQPRGWRYVLYSSRQLTTWLWWSLGALYSALFGWMKSVVLVASLCFLPLVLQANYQQHGGDGASYSSESTTSIQVALRTTSSLPASAELPVPTASCDQFKALPTWPFARERDLFAGLREDIMKITNDNLYESSSHFVIQGFEFIAIKERLVDQYSVLRESLVPRWLALQHDIHYDISKEEDVYAQRKAIDFGFSRLAPSLSNCISLQAELFGTNGGKAHLLSELRSVHDAIQREIGWRNGEALGMTYKALRLLKSFPASLDDESIENAANWAMEARLKLELLGTSVYPEPCISDQVRTIMTDWNRFVPGDVGIIEVDDLDKLETLVQRWPRLPATTSNAPSPA